MKRRRDEGTKSAHSVSSSLCLSVSSSTKLRIIVGGMVGQYPMGGVAFDYFHYVLGLAELGHEVYYHEDTWVWPFDPVRQYPTDDPTYTVNFLKNFFASYAPSLADHWHYVLLHEKHFGMSSEAFDEVARTADIFLNVSGACIIPRNLNPKCLKVFVDTDPGYNQIVMSTRPAWSENVDRWIEMVRSHDRHLTYAENLFADDCLVPKVDLNWLPTRCVVTLSPWKDLLTQPPPGNAAFSTVMTWGYFKGSLKLDGVEYHAKATEFEKFADLPSRVNMPLTLAATGKTIVKEDLQRKGWQWVEASEVTFTPQRYVDFIRDSAGEWSIAKNVYVATMSGWFSCRSACYLAAGRPCVLQDTAWSRYVPAGAGVFAFDTLAEAAESLRVVSEDLPRQRQAAYEVAREYLAPDKVLVPMLESIFRNERVLPPGPSKTVSP